jgi:hypothetical protein
VLRTAYKGRRPWNENRFVRHPKGSEGIQSLACLTLNLRRQSARNQSAIGAKAKASCRTVNPVRRVKERGYASPTKPSARRYAARGISTEMYKSRLDRTDIVRQLAATTRQ